MTMKKHNTSSTPAGEEPRHPSASHYTSCKCPPLQGRVGVGALAMRYYPGRGYKRAVTLFRQELCLTRGLLDALQAIGYHESQRILSPRQVKVIEEYLGEP